MCVTIGMQISPGPCSAVYHIPIKYTSLHSTCLVNTSSKLSMEKVYSVNNKRRIGH